VGDIRPPEEYGTYDVSGTIGGAESTIDGARECDDITLGWYDLRGVTGLLHFCKLDPYSNCD
jgi:hypothetical protein